MAEYPMRPLGEVLVQDRSYIAEPEARMYPKLSVKLYGRGVVLDSPADGATLKMKRHQVARAGQVILSEIWGKKGAVGIVPEEGEGALCTSHFFLFDIDRERILPAYVGWLLRANYLAPVLEATAQGSTGYAAIRPSQFLEMTVPLPDIEEQRRVVGRIDAVAERVADVRSLRAANDDDAMTLYRLLAGDLFEGSPEKVLLGSLAEVRGGIQKSSARTPQDNPRRYITVAHVQRNRILTDDPRYFEVSDAEFERKKLLPGDVLVIEGNGSANHIGRTALFTGQIEDCVHQNHVIRVRPDTSRIGSAYLNAYLNSPAGQQQMREISRTSSGLYSLSVERIRGLWIPLPPLGGQEYIMDRLATLDHVYDRLRNQSVEQAKSLDALLASTLDSAFAGQL